MNSYGVVSLLDMLEYAASDFYIISSTVTQLMAYNGKLLEIDANVAELSDNLKLLHGYAQKLEMQSTLFQIAYIAEYLIKRRLNVRELSNMLMELQKRVTEDLQARMFKCIPSGRNFYIDPKWLTDSDLFKHHDPFEEFQAAGRCFAFEENAACVFHLMRVVDWGLRRIAGSLSISYDARNWMGIADAITKQMEKKYTAKSADWRKSEPFYAETLTDIQAISRGHRNPVLHEIEKKYDDKETRSLLTIVESFILHVLKTIP